MIKKIVNIIIIILTSYPAYSLAVSKAGIRDVQDIKIDIENRHKKEIKDELNETSSGYDVDLTKSSFSSDIRIGVTNMTGNTRSIAVNGTNVTKYRHKRMGNTWNLGAFYSRVFSATNSSTIGTSVRYIYGNYRMDYYILRRFTYFLGGGGYSNELKGIDIAGQGFTGFKYYFLMEPDYYFSGSLGYNYTYENILPPDKNRQIHSAVLMLDYEHNISKNLKIEEHVEVLEDAEDGREIRVNSDTSIRVLFTKHFGTALGFKIIFDNQPPRGYKKLDTITSFSLAVIF